ncbi:ABC transporter ATP-binding protein [Aeromicrobium sp. YIM 150415]|uniref:ABC transporter ATP-binding protein n=1 Tax=Aeromicrobium piscarium TaxID=2590901 RepID=A0A554S9S8_9ACTN|nr:MULTISPECIES: ABC transporter ATP-binding protein [Aeromicrobium]MBM9464296.1 ABC transporter ATP-binding protein [Aeromicrobium sp. YIM 150415]TSD63101.1 ABC transporter ATP-binding protein [Aeromicrobium piscarium]
MSADASLDSLGSGDTRQLTRRGFGVMGVGIRREPWMFTLAVILSLLFGVMTVADAWVLGWATDHVITPSFADGEVARGALNTGIVLFIAAALLRMIGVIGRRLAGGVVFYRLVRDDRLRVTRQYLQLPLRWHHRHPAGQLLSNANADVEATWSVFMPLPMALGVIAMLLAAIGTMAAADPVLTLIGLVVFPLLFAVNAVYQRWQGPRLALAQSLRGDVSSVAHESFDGALVVKSLGREGDETARFARISERLRDANVAVGRVRAVFDPVIEALPNLGVLLVIGVGAQRIASGAAAPGDVVQVAFLFTVVAMPVRSFGWVLGELPRAVIGWQRVRRVLDDDDHMAYGEHALPGSGAVRLDVTGLDYAHPDEPDTVVLRDVDFSVPAGRVVAVVGATGSGKSTLASLVTRLVDADAGAVRYDGVGVQEFSQAALTGTAALVAQSTFLFDDSVRANIVLDREVPEDRIWSVLRDVQADRFVSELPQGLDTQLGERGTSLSGGQRQRIALARALVREPRLLVMDDATSALDPDVEQRILRALAERSESGSGPSVLVVAYRKATIGLADEVIFLADGKIADRGTHAELRERSRAYRNIVDAYDQAREEVDHE